MKKRTKWILGALAGVVVIAIVVANFSRDTKKGITVQAEQAANRKLVQIVSASGRIQPQTKVDITAQINGQIIGLNAKEGDTIASGDLLIVLDTVQLRADVDQASYAMAEITARLDGAKSAWEQAEDEFKRQEKLYGSGLTSDAAFTAAKFEQTNTKATYEAYQAQAKQARARYDQQVDNLRKTRIRAPMAGVVTLVDCEVGEVAPAQTAFTQGKTLMTISNLDVFEVEVEVDETEVAKVSFGQPADIEVDAFPDSTFKGTVTEIGNTAVTSSLGSSEQSTNFRVKVIFTEPSVRLRPGMSATVDITTETRDDVLAVPYSAIVIRSFSKDSAEAIRSGKPLASAPESTGAVGTAHASEGDSEESASADEPEERVELKGVFVISEAKTRFVEVETGVADRKFIEVTKGLSTKDSIVTGPYSSLRTLKPGDQVKTEGKNKKESGGSAE